MATDYKSRLSIALTGDSVTRFFTGSGAQLAVGYSRVVVGGRGPYVEFEKRHIASVALRLVDAPHYYYDELRSVADNVKVYLQRRPVTYADYVVGMLYASPFELFDESGAVIIEPLISRR